jgi:hypothetical protein
MQNHIKNLVMSFKHENKCPAYTCTGRVHHGREFRLGRSRSDRATCWGFSLGGDCSSAAERDHGSVVLSPAINRCGSSLCVDSQHRGGGVSWRPQAKGRRGAALGPGHSLVRRKKVPRNCLRPCRQGWAIWC